LGSAAHRLWNSTNSRRQVGEGGRNWVNHRGLLGECGAITRRDGRVARDRHVWLLLLAVKSVEAGGGGPLVRV
jgi:hypothetical protein